MRIEKYQDLIVWKEGKDLAVTIFRISDAFLKNDWSLKDQIRRSALSIPSNIAEGFARGNNKEFVQFLRIAIGSCCELNTQLLIAFETGKLPKKLHQELESKLASLELELRKFVTYLKSNQKKYKSHPNT